MHSALDSTAKVAFSTMSGLCQRTIFGSLNPLVPRMAVSGTFTTLKKTAMVSYHQQQQHRSIATFNMITYHRNTATRNQPSNLQYSAQRSYSCQFGQETTKMGQIRSKLRSFGQGSIELDINHSPGLALLTLSNPTRHNSLTGKMMAELADVVDLLEAAVPKDANRASSGSGSGLGSGSSDSDGWNQVDEILLHQDSQVVLKNRGQVIDRLRAADLKVVQGLVGIVVTGGGQKSFCAGLDLAEAKATLLTPQGGSEFSVLMNSTLLRFVHLPLISIAAIEHAAVGGGAEMTTICDHRCVSDSAKIQFVQTKMGVVTGWGGASRLFRIVGRSRALRMLSGGEPIVGGTKAKEVGFADLTAPAGETVEKAVEYMQQYVWESKPAKDADTTGQDLSVESGRRCVKVVRNFKEIVNLGYDEKVQEVAQLEKDLFKDLWGEKDNLARVAAAGSKKRK